MKPENLELALKAGFRLNPKVEGYYTGIDWSVASYGHRYESCLEKLIDLAKDTELKQLVNKLFTEYLDVQEESDSGRMFHPITISCCRAAKLKPLSDLLERLKELSK